MPARRATIGANGVELVAAEAEVADAPALAALDELVADLVDGADEGVGGLPRPPRGEAEGRAPARSISRARSSVTMARWTRTCSSSVVEAVAGGVADPAELAVGGGGDAVGEGPLVDHAGGAG